MWHIDQPIATEHSIERDKSAPKKTQLNANKYKKQRKHSGGSTASKYSKGKNGRAQSRSKSGTKLVAPDGYKRTEKSQQAIIRNNASV